MEEEKPPAPESPIAPANEQMLATPSAPAGEAGKQFTPTQPGQPAPVDVLLSQLPALAETLARSQIDLRKVEQEGRISELRLMNSGRSEEMAARERMANARLEHERSMEREQRRFDRLILTGVFVLYAALILYGMFAPNGTALASGITGLVSFVAGFSARSMAPRPPQPPA